MAKQLWYDINKFHEGKNVADCLIGTASREDLHHYFLVLNRYNDTKTGYLPGAYLENPEKDYVLVSGTETTEEIESFMKKIVQWSLEDKDFSEEFNERTRQLEKEFQA